MLSRRFVLGGLISAPAVIAADKLMSVRSIVKPYATVWGVGWDLEVVEHQVWSQQEALGFAKWDGPLVNFREVTEIVYTKPQAPLLPMKRPNDWQQRKTAAQEWFLKERQAIVDEATGFTNVTGFDALKKFKAEQNVKMFEATKHLNIVGVDQSVA